MPGRSAVDAVALAQQDDRPLRRFQQRALAGGHRRERLRGRRVRDHHRERLFLARLAFAQLRHRAGVGGIAGQMEPAEPLDRDDLPAREPAHGVGNRVDVFDRRAARIAQREPRPADRAGVRLGVEAPVVGCAVLGGAFRTLAKPAMLVVALS